MKTGSEGARLIAAERVRQVEVEGWTPAHDESLHTNHELALAAACYAAPDRVFIGRASEQGVQLEEAWPWERKWDKRDKDVRCWFPKPLAIVLTNRPEVRAKRIRELVKAGALIAAEIDRLNALEGKST